MPEKYWESNDAVDFNFARTLSTLITEHNLLKKKMGSLCSKESCANESIVEIAKQECNVAEKSKVQVVAPSPREEVIAVVDMKNEGDTKSKLASDANAGRSKESGKTIIVERPKDGHRRSTSGLGAGNQLQPSVSRIASMSYGIKGEQIAAGWPTWLSSVAAEAIQGLVPRNAESFEKFEKIGQGTYSTVYKARDLTTQKIVAMKKVRFVNMDPESVRFMAREISILRRLDHPNVMKLQGVVTSRISGSLYLVFDYMEHDLSGLAASPEATFTEPQIKCFVQQMLQGLEHCHSRGVLHRDIKGSNLLVDDNGILRLGDFGLATTFQPNQTEPLTSRVVTLWYRAPELLLGATDYGVAIDIWSVGCILAELFAGKQILPGRTEVEQIHKIFKLCGSPSEEFWRKSKQHEATSFKPQHPYKRNLANVFKDFPPSALALVDRLLSIEPEARGTAASALKSEFFSTKPLACDPSSLPKFSPSKELDAKHREEERRRKAESVKGRDESIQKNSRNSSDTPDHDRQGQGQSNKCTSVKVNPQEDSGAGFPIEPPRGYKNGFSHSNSMIHPDAARTNKMKNNANHAKLGRTYSTTHHGTQLNRKTSGSSHGAMNFTSIHTSRNDIVSGINPTEFAGKRNRIHCSGPLMAPGGNMEDMLKEHEKQIQEAVRKARLHKNHSRLN